MPRSGGSAMLPMNLPRPYDVEPTRTSNAIEGRHVVARRDRRDDRVARALDARSVGEPYRHGTSQTTRRTLTVNHIEAARYHAAQQHGLSLELASAADRIWKRHGILPYLGDDYVRRLMWDALMILAIIPLDRKPDADTARLAEQMLKETVEFALEAPITVVPGIPGYPNYLDALLVYLFRRTEMLFNYPATTLHSLSANVGMPTLQLRGRLEDVALLGQLSPRMAVEYVQGHASTEVRLGAMK